MTPPFDPHEMPFPGAQDSTAFGGTVMRCAWRGCGNTGEHRAPKDRNLDDYYLFCLEHARAYNAQWNFHAGLKPDEIESEIRRSVTWDRPTWKLGTLGGGTRPGRKRTHDPFGFAEGTAFDEQRARKAREDAQRSADPALDKALRVLDLAMPFTMETLRRKYKALVKKHHPDANGGSRDAERRMQTINAAYQTLRATLVAAN